MFEKVIGILSDYTDVPPESISGESRLIGDLGISSFELIGLICMFEEEYGVTIDESKIVELQTVNDVVEFLNGLENN